MVRAPHTNVHSGKNHNVIESGPDQARQWLQERDKTLLHFIRGKWVEPESGAFFETVNPASGASLARVADGNAADVNRAVAAAADALEGWVVMGGHGRARCLCGMARYIQKSSRLFSVLDSTDNGKRIRESRDMDIPLVARHFYYHAGWAQVMHEQMAGYRPIGVVGQIIPRNLPLLMLAWKAAPALAMGNTVVLKPAESASFTAVLFAQMCIDIGLPPGVFNLVLGDHKAGEALTNHPEVGMLVFTGSTELGRMLRKTTAGTGKKLTLELEGKSPLVVFEDSSLEAGFGRESGKEGLYDYVKPFWESKLSKDPVQRMPRFVPVEEIDSQDAPGIDRTPRLYIGGRQIHPDGGYGQAAFDATGKVIAEIPTGNQKDIRNAVEAARAATGWGSACACNRAQVLFCIAESLSARSDEFVRRISQLSGKDEAAARIELDLCIRRIYTYAAMSDKYGGQVHATALRRVILAMREPLGLMGIIAPEEAGLLGFISTVMPAIAMGNRVVVVPSWHYALLATDFYQVLDTSDLPGGVINVITGDQHILAEMLTKHCDVEGMWYWGSRRGSLMIEEEAAATMKRTWVNYGLYHDWEDDEQGQGETFLRRATEIKNIWIPYGG